MWKQGVTSNKDSIRINDTNSSSNNNNNNNNNESNYKNNNKNNNNINNSSNNHTKLPICIFTVVFINVIFYNMSSSVAYSFLPRLMKEFGATELKTGYYAGMTASSVFVGRLFFSMIWGYLTDTIGKRTSSILTGALLLITTAFFGFSQNFYWAITTRFLQGCSMGQVIVSKAILACMCDDDTISIGMSVVMTALVTGQAVGPSIGGFLAFPGSQYPGLFRPGILFTKFSILLPNLVICLGLLAGIVLTLCFVPNDRSATQRCLKDAVSYGALDESQSSGRKDRLLRDTDYEKSCNLIMEPHNPNLDNSIDEKQSPTKQAEKRSILASSQCQQHTPNLLQRLTRSKFVSVLREKDCVCCSVLYGMFALTDVVFIEMFPVLAATDRRYNGLGFKPKQIGVVLLAVSLTLVTLQLTLLPKLNKKFGSKQLLIISNIVFAFLLPMLPSISAIRNRSATWACLLLLVFLIRACVFTSYLSLNILVNNSVGPALFGSANGVAMTLASLGRLIGPFAFGSLFSWSLTNVEGVEGNERALGFPLNQYLIFVLLSGFSLGTALFANQLPETLNYKKTEKTENS